MSGLYKVYQFPRFFDTMLDEIKDLSKLNDEGDGFDLAPDDMTKLKEFGIDKE